MARLFRPGYIGRMEAETNPAWLEHLHGAEALSTEGRAALLSARRLEIGPGQSLFQPGTLCEGLPFVVSGSIKVRLISETGREIVLYRVGAGQTCIMTTSCLLSGDPYAAEGITETKTELRLLPASLFDNLIAREPSFRKLVFSGFADRLAASYDRLEEVAFHSIDKRLARLLTAGKSAEVNMTHGDIAAELGSSREVVTRALSRFATNGWVETHRGSIRILDRGALRALGDGD